MPRHFMNPALGKHMGSEEHAGAKGKEHSGGKEHEGPGGAHPHSIHIHHAGEGEPHADNPHHVHIHHASGEHEHSDHNNFHEAMSHAKSTGGGDEMNQDGETSRGGGNDAGDEYGLGKL